MKSPCNDICTIDRTSSLCVGCARTLPEIGEWASASDARKKAILALLPARIAALGTKFRR
ncbi:DUF1289 domain-containing protein [Parasphingorhabdus sp.]|uniref:DUF1289 domain-containing protein n=1 Tax=Parasphingorhabdus sp. TaxID=2709688 RepID=UPI003593C469